MSSFLHIQDLAFSHGKKHLFHQVNLDFGSELVALVGLNGSGKSSFLELLAGNNEAKEGMIRIKNKAIHSWSKIDLAKEIALVLTSFDIDSELTVQDVLHSARIPFTGYFGRLTANDKEIVSKVVRDLQLEELLLQKFYACSDGEKQRILIGTAFIKQASIILLDEPTAFMDLNHKIEFFNLLKDEAEGKLVIFSTHDVELALQVADRILILHENKMKLYTKEEVLKDGVLNEMFSASRRGFNEEGKLML